MRKIGVVTVARSDYGIYQPVLNAIEADPELELSIIASGMHLCSEYGMTVELIKEDGFRVAERVEMLSPAVSDGPGEVAKAMARGISGFAEIFERSRPDILLVLGDRYEMYSAALAALPFKIPVAHIHGGEITEGAIDDALRHSMTKLSHLHFTSTEGHRQRVLQLGEEPWRVTVSGAPALDHLNTIDFMTTSELNDKFGLSLCDEPFLLATFHPVTLEYEKAEEQITEFLGAISESRRQVVFTLANSDTGGKLITEKMKRFVQKSGRASLVKNFGPRAYFSAMKLAEAMVGNSSSGIVEAASFSLPVVNIGIRQRGRLSSANVIDVPCEKEAITNGIEKVLSPDFKESLKDLKNPYGAGRAAEKITKVLRNITLDDKLLIKSFNDMGLTQAGGEC